MPPKQGFLINLGCILGLQGLCELPEFEGKPYVYAFFLRGRSLTYSFHLAYGHEPSVSLPPLAKTKPN